MQSVLLERITEHALRGDLDTFFFAPTVFGVALPTTGAQDAITIDNDGAFLLEYINGNISQPAGTNIAFPDILVDLRNQSSGRYFSKKPMHWNTIIGNAQNPFILPEPMIIPAMGSLNVSLTNLSGGQYARVDMTFVGQKIVTLGGFKLDDLKLPLDFAYSPQREYSYS